MIVLHIGLPKSGSTTIQTFLEANQDPLRGLSIDYTQVGRRRQKAHHTLSFELKGWDGRMNPRAGRLADLACDVRESGHRVTIVSSELLSDLKPRQIRQLKKELEPARQPFRIIIIMRDQLSSTVSLYGQKTRYGERTFNFDEFFYKFSVSNKFGQFEIAERWANIFGWDAIRVRMLDRAQLINGDLIDDFLENIDVDAMSPQIRALTRRLHVNESSGWRTTEAVRAIFSGNCIVKCWPYLSKISDADLARPQRHSVGLIAEEVAEKLSWTKDKGLYLTRAQAQICSDSHLYSIQRLNSFLSAQIHEPFDLEERGFVERSFLPEACRIEAAELCSFYRDLQQNLVERLDFISSC